MDNVLVNVPLAIIKYLLIVMKFVKNAIQNVENVRILVYIVQVVTIINIYYRMNVKIVLVYA